MMKTQGRRRKGSLGHRTAGQREPRYVARAGVQEATKEPKKKLLLFEALA